MDDREQFVRQWYGALCAEARQLLKKPDVPCMSCGRPRKDHDGSNRCSASAITTHYSPINIDEVQRVASLLIVLENLASICGWKL